MQQMQIENPRDYHVSDVGMGDKVIPNEEESLEGVAYVAGSRIDDTTSIDYTGDGSPPKGTHIPYPSQDSSHSWKGMASYESSKL